MDRIIKSISEIENDSVKIMDDANTKKSDIFARIQDETTAFDKELESETNKRIDDLKQQMEQDMQEKLAKQKNLADEVLMNLTKHYESNRTVYIERLFDEMTGV